MMGYGVSLRSCGQFSPHLLVPSLNVVCYRGPVPLLDLDALCVKEGGVVEIEESFPITQLDSPTSVKDIESSKGTRLNACLLLGVNIISIRIIIEKIPCK